MTTKVIRIPKLSLLKEEDGLFADLYGFLVMVESLYYRSQGMNTNRSALNMIQELKLVENTPVSHLKELVDILQYVVSLQNGRRNSAKNSKAKVFSSKLLSRWRSYKTALKIRMNYYMNDIRRLRESQIVYWRSRVDVKKYSKMIELSQISRDAQVNTKVQNQQWGMFIGGLKEELGSKLSLHMTNAKEYYQALEEERITRQSLVELSKALEKDITIRIKVKIQNALNIYRYEHSSYDPDLNVMSKGIYDLLTRTFTLTNPPSDVNDPDFNKIMPYPDERKPLYDPVNKNKISASYSYTESVPERDSVEIEENTTEPNEPDIPQVPSGHEVKQGPIDIRIGNTQDTNENAYDTTNGRDDCKDPTINNEPEVRVKKKGLFAAFRRKFMTKRRGYSSID